MNISVRNGMNGIVRSAPDIHSQTGSASDAIIADANTRSSIVGGAGAQRFKAINAIATAASIFSTLPRLADPGLGAVIRAYHWSSGGCGAADSNPSAIRFDLIGLRGAYGRPLIGSDFPPRLCHLGHYAASSAPSFSLTVFLEGVSVVFKLRKNSSK